ncbi:hypothetical protein [Paraoerskovia sediminicola]|uniref:hypothetical protein n=1 Tax=Paraoerskovia sediminicola TaxID=1138587 RepID=UPI002572CEA9|nr:hypothetical protein [Paraoerskovia sediminicola]
MKPAPPRTLAAAGTALLLLSATACTGPEDAADGAAADPGQTSGTQTGTQTDTDGSGEESGPEPLEELTPVEVCEGYIGRFHADDLVQQVGTLAAAGPSADPDEVAAIHAELEPLAAQAESAGDEDIATGLADTLDPFTRYLEEVEGGTQSPGLDTAQIQAAAPGILTACSDAGYVVGP